MANFENHNNAEDYEYAEEEYYEDVDTPDGNDEYIDEENYFEGDIPESSVPEEKQMAPDNTPDSPSDISQPIQQNDFVALDGATLKDICERPDKYHPGELDKFLYKLYTEFPANDVKRLIPCDVKTQDFLNQVRISGIHLSEAVVRQNISVITFLNSKANTIPQSRFLSGGYCVPLDFNADVTSPDITTGTQFMTYLVAKCAKLKGGKMQDAVQTISNTLSTAHGDTAKFFDTLWWALFPDMSEEPEKNVPARIDINLLSDELQEEFRHVHDVLSAFYKKILMLPFGGIIATGPDGLISAWSIVNGSYSPLSNTLKIRGRNAITADSMIEKLASSADLLSDSWRLTSVQASIQPNPNQDLVVNILNKKKRYIPELHIGVLSGVTTNGSISLDYKDHALAVYNRLLQIYLQLDSYLQANNITNVAEVQEKMNMISSAILNMVIVSDTKPYLWSYITTYNFKAIDAAIEGFEKTNVKIAKDDKTVLQSFDKGKYKLQIFYYCTNYNAYSKEINFGYKAVLELAERGIKSDFKRVLIGKNRDNGMPVSLDFSLNSRFCIAIYGGTRSGKGVLTLCTLGTAIATGHPFVYLDNKPDMAPILWGMEACSPSKKPFLVLDAAVEKEDLSGVARYVPTRVTNARLRAQKSFADLVKRYPELQPVNKVNLIRCTIVCKYTQLLLLFNHLGKKFGLDSKLFAVIDETNDISLSFNSLLTDLRSYFQNIVGTCKKTIGDKKASEEDKAKAKKTKELFNTMFYALNFVPPTDTQQKIRARSDCPGVSPELTSAVDDFLDKTGGANGNLLVTCIGQHANKISPDFPWIAALYAEKSTKIYGRENGEISEKNPSKFVREFTADEVDTGKFMVADSGMAFNTRCSTYLTLNENDAVYTASGKKTKRKFFNNEIDSFVKESFLSDPGVWLNGRVWNPDLEPDDPMQAKPDNRVGFDGYMELLASTNNITMNQVYDIMSKGYEIATKMLAPVLKEHNYDCIEDWFYDVTPESYYRYFELLQKCDGGSISDDMLQLMATVTTEDMDTDGMPMGSGTQMTAFTMEPEDTLFIDTNSGKVATPQEKEKIMSAIDACKFVWEHYFSQESQKEAYFDSPRDTAVTINLFLKTTDTEIKDVIALVADAEYPALDNLNSYITNIRYAKLQWETEARDRGLIV